MQKADGTVGEITVTFGCTVENNSQKARSVRERVEGLL
jgi:hypothetical protein